MSMADACTAYDISSRTFYRWLRSKPKLLAAAAATSTSAEPDSQQLQMQLQPELQPEAQSLAKRPRVDGCTRIEVVVATAAYTKPDSAASSAAGLSAGITACGGPTAVVNWYPGARSVDIIASISRQLNLDSRRWYLTRTGPDDEEVIVSEGLPSGKYVLVIYDE